MHIESQHYFRGLKSKSFCHFEHTVEVGGLALSYRRSVMWVWFSSLGQACLLRKKQLAVPQHFAPGTGLLRQQRLYGDVIQQQRNLLHIFSPYLMVSFSSELMAKKVAGQFFRPIGRTGHDPAVVEAVQFPKPW